MCQFQQPFLAQYRAAHHVSVCVCCKTMGVGLNHVLHFSACNFCSTDVKKSGFAACLFLTCIVHLSHPLSVSLLGQTFDFAVASLNRDQLLLACSV